MSTLDDFADLPEVAALLQLAKADPEECHCAEATEALEAMAEKTSGLSALWVTAEEIAASVPILRWQLDYERGLNEVLCIVARKHGEMLRSCEEELDEECTRAERAEAEVEKERWIADECVHLNNNHPHSGTWSREQVEERYDRLMRGDSTPLRTRYVDSRELVNAEARIDELEDEVERLKHLLYGDGVTDFGLSGAHASEWKKRRDLEDEVERLKPVTCGECAHDIGGSSQCAAGVGRPKREIACSLGKRKDSP